MGQQPNIELEIADLPRPSRKPDPARSWTPGRPAELGGPEDARFGGGFGTTGPDAGYALSLVAARAFELADGEHRENANVAVACVASARSALFGRAPTGQDVDLALVVLGYDGDQVPAEMSVTLGAARVRWFAAAAHHPANLHDFVAGLDADVLRLTADQARAQMAQGTQLIAP